MSWEIRQGDCLALLGGMESESVQTCVTSPPYWGLRDYGSDSQLGLELTPEEYVANLVAVFEEVRRVLREDGTVWLNLGDSYAARLRQSGAEHAGELSRSSKGVRTAVTRALPGGLKEKDLVGIPWMVAEALKAPRFTGTIKDERDRIWLAAMIDAEGCIYIHKRKAGASNGQGYERKADSFGSGMEISNTSRAIVERVQVLTGRGSISEASQDARRRQTLYRWNLRTNECREVLREVYPHLIAKQRQARIAIGCPSSGKKASAAHEALKILHAGGLTDVDFPTPASMFEPGWYLRSDCIWSKPNPMPESVTDRPTRSHEYIFLLSKSARYFYDAEAVREEDLGADHSRNILHRPEPSGGVMGPHNGIRQANGRAGLGRNRRSVWSVTTQPYPETHFATFPPKLIEPCILAGSAEGDTVLDPFAGAGTTGLVALRHGRSFLGFELNPDYCELARNRIRDDAPLLNVPAEIDPAINAKRSEALNQEPVS